MNDSKTTVPVEVRYHFSDAEKIDLVSQLAKSIENKSELETEKKEFIDDIKDKIESAESDIHSLASKVRNGYEPRFVRCFIEKDFDLGMMIFRNAETNEVVTQRPMTEQEKQQSFMD